MKKISSIFYMYSGMDGSSQVLLFLIILVSLMLLSIVVINSITKRKNLKSDNDNYNINRYSSLMKNKEKKEDIVEEKIETLEVIEVLSEKNSIEEISELIENTLEQEPINMTFFEEEQEKDAIISYDELVKKAGAKKIVYKCEETIEKEVTNDMNKDVSNKFKVSQIVSPVYGVQKKDIENDMENFIDLEEFPFEEEYIEDIEMQKDMEFLGSLKTFRNNLD